MRPIALLVPAGLGLLYWLTVDRTPAMAALSSSSASAARERIVSLARAYLEEWPRLTADEKLGRVRQFWIDGAGTDQGFREGWPWSGAFITAIVNQAVPGALPKVPRHTAYTRASLEGKTGFAVADARFQFVVEPGDLVLTPRPGGAETFGDLGRPEGFDAHVDIVSEVGFDRVRAIGGNKVAGAVGIEDYAREPSGVLVPPVIAILRLKGG